MARFVVFFVLVALVLAPVASARTLAVADSSTAGWMAPVLRTLAQAVSWLPSGHGGLHRFGAMIIPDGLGAMIIADGLGAMIIADGIGVMIAPDG